MAGYFLESWCIAGGKRLELLQPFVADFEACGGLLVEGAGKLADVAAKDVARQANVVGQVVVGVFYGVVLTAPELSRD